MGGVATAGQPSQEASTNTDAMERRLAEDVRAHVSQRWLEALELERICLARDLRDEIGLRLTLLSVDLEQLRRLPFDSPVVRGPYIDTLQEHTRRTSPPR